jgi:hypothetical protein
MNNVAGHMNKGTVPGPFENTPVGVVGHFLRGKEAPLVSLAHDILAGKDFAGKPVDMKAMNMNNPLAKRFIPMFVQDMIDVYKEDPSQIPNGMKIIFGAGGALGMGLQDYQREQKPDLQLRIR